MPSVVASSSVGASSNPERHTAWVTVGSTGVTSAHDVPVSVTV